MAAMVALPADGIWCWGSADEIGLIDSCAGLAGGAEDGEFGEVLRMFGDGAGDGVASDSDDVGCAPGGVIESCLPTVVVSLVEDLAEGNSGLLNGSDVL